MEDGLPVAGIYGCFQDHFGYLWISSQNGVSRFDGRQFKNYGLSDGLPSLNVNCFLEDDQYRFWIGSVNGMARLMGDRFVVYPVKEEEKISYCYSVIQIKNGKIWALTDNGVYQFEDTIWHKIELYPGLENTRNIIETDSGLYINYGKKLVFRDLQNKWVVLDEHESMGPYFNSMKKHSGRIFVNTKNTLYEIKDRTLKPIVKDLKGRGHFSYFFDSDDRLWYVYALSDSFFHVSAPGRYNDFKNVLPNHYDVVWGVYEDSYKNFWISTSEGLLKLDLSSFSIIDQKSKTFTKGLGIIPLLDSRFLYIKDNKAYSAAYNKNETRFKFNFLKSADLGIIDCYDQDDKGGVWFATREGKLYSYYDQQLNDITGLLPPEWNELFHSCAYDKTKNRFFLCGHNSVITGNEKNINVFAPANINMKLSFGARVLSTKSGQILFYLPGNGIFKLDKNDSLHLLSGTPKNSNRFLGVLYEDDNNNIWFGDGTMGLLCFRFTNGKFELVDSISQKEGLLDNVVYSIVSDHLGRIWIVNPLGIDILRQNKNRWEVFNYSKDINLKLNYNLGRLSADKTGNIWFYDLQQLVAFDAVEVQLNKELPSVMIEKIQVNSKDADWNKYTDSAFSYRRFPVNPRLRYQSNTVTVFFNCISYTSAPHPEYSYQLSPLDTIWSPPNSNSSVSFVKLPPGKYTFKVKTRDRASAWSEPAVFSFTISTPFWMRYWFILICAVALVSIIYGIYRYRVNQIKKILVMRTEISRDLHDEIGSTLTSINILSKVSQRNLRSETEKVAGFLEKITEQSATIQQNMSDIVWSIHPENDKLSDLIIRMRQFIGHTAEARGMKISFTVDERIHDIGISMHQRQNIFLIFKEAVNNAVKYSKAEMLFIDIGLEKSKIRLMVKDDGIGFVSDEKEFSNGLKNMGGRAKDLKGTLDIQSLPGKGVCITLICPAT